MTVNFLTRASLRIAARRAICVTHTEWLRTAGIVAVLLLGAIAIAATAVQSSQAQTPGTGQRPNSPSPGDRQNGRLVFKNQNCDKCHGSQGEGIAAPVPNGGVTRIASTTLTLPAFVQLVRKPKGTMPPFSIQQVSDLELTDVYAYLASAAPPVEHEADVATNPTDGQRLFTKYGCAECHLSHGQGSRPTGVRLAPAQIPLSAFVNYVRQPTGEMPPYTEKTVSNEELAEMYSFLHSVPQPSSWKAILLLNQ